MGHEMEQIKQEAAGLTTTGAVTVSLYAGEEPPDCGQCCQESGVAAKIAGAYNGKRSGEIGAWLREKTPWPYKRYPQPARSEMENEDTPRDALHES